MKDCEYRVEMKWNPVDEWKGKPDAWTADYGRASNWLRNGRYDYGGGLWRLLERSSDGEIRIVHEDTPPPPGLLERTVDGIMDRFFGRRS